MQEYKKIIIGKDEIIPVAERMRKEGRYLVMIHAFFNKDGEADISYDYAVDPAVESYHVIGEMKVPSISEIYDTAASWPERELNELMGIEFEGRFKAPVPARRHARNAGQGSDTCHAAEGTGR